MAYTESVMIALGTKAPEFKLPDTVSGKNFTFNDIKGAKGTMVMFICNHCPYVIHVNEELVKLAQEYADKGIGFVGISSNDAINYPQDGPEKMKEHAKEVGYPFPYLYDETQEVAKAYDAACTPDIYLFDSDDLLYYRGRIDESRPKNGIPLTGRDIREALDYLLEGMPAPVKQYPGGGCNIKWKS